MRCVDSILQLGTLSMRADPRPRVPSPETVRGGGDLFTKDPRTVSYPEVLDLTPFVGVRGGTAPSRRLYKLMAIAAMSVWPVLRGPANRPLVLRPRIRPPVRKKQLDG